MRILVIEDDKALREQLCGLLEDNKFETLQAKDEKEAEDILAEYGDTVSIAIIDMHLPPKSVDLDFKESGLRIIQLMTASYQHIVSIVLTAHEDFDNSMRCLDAGASDYLVKAMGIKNTGRGGLLLKVVRRAEKRVRAENAITGVYAVLEDMVKDIDKVTSFFEKLSNFRQRIQNELPKTRRVDMNKPDSAKKVPTKQEQSLDLSLELVREGESIIKGPDLFWREDGDDVESPGESGGELLIMRRWNSHTPSVYDVLGGGYFLRWRRAGTVIDPGCNFLKLFRRKTRYNIGDIDMVVATHDHLDHCQDFAALIALFRQFNSWSVESGNKTPKVWDMILSHGVADMYASILEHPDNAPFLFRQTVLPNEPQPVEGRQERPKFLRDAYKDKGDILAKEPYLEVFCSEAVKPISKKYSYALSVLPAYHKELLGAMTAFGLKIKLKKGKSETHDSAGKPPPTIVISGDTSINGIREKNDTKDDNRNDKDTKDGGRDKEYMDGNLLSSFYCDADLLILHVGGLEKLGEERHKTGKHLGLYGIVEILFNLFLSGKMPTMVVLTEWGYEFGRIGTNGRSTFVQKVVLELEKKQKKSPYYAAVEIEVGGKIDPPEKPAKGEKKIPIIPADIGLRISLPDLKIECVRRNGKPDFEDCHNIFAREVLEEIEYHAIL